MGDERKIPVPNHFEVKYRFLTHGEGGRKDQRFYQGYRPDWAYEGDDIKKGEVYIIWPVFLNDDGEDLEMDAPVANEGVARMFIVNELALPIHKNRIKIGTRGFFLEVPNRVAQAEVTRIVELNNE